jgi:hypothetical protein
MFIFNSLQFVFAFFMNVSTMDADGVLRLICIIQLFLIYCLLMKKCKCDSV